MELQNSGMGYRAGRSIKDRRNASFSRPPCHQGPGSRKAARLQFGLALVVLLLDLGLDIIMLNEMIVESLVGD